MRARGDGTWAVMAGGGTGGHLYPGVAIAGALRARGHDPSSLRFVGARRGLESRTKALTGYPVTLLPGRGLRRKFTGAAVTANLAAVAEAGAAVIMAVRLFAQWRPAVVVSFGGYASFPCVIAAAAWRVPVVVVNLDAIAGLTNRLAARVAVSCAVASEGARLPHATVTGVPVRREMMDVDRSPFGQRAARAELGLPESSFVVGVSGGSLGARRLNLAALELAGAWADRSGTALRHVVGLRDWGDLASRVPGSPGGLVYQQVPYEEHMATLYAAADVMVQRAGASTVAELALAGVPSVLVPLPGAPGDHQGANARVLASAGAAKLVADADLDGQRLAAELERLQVEPALLARMGEAAKALGRPQAADRVADLVERAAGWVAPGAGAEAEAASSRDGSVPPSPGRDEGRARQ